MIGNLKPCGLGHFSGPFRNITKVKFDDLPTSLTDDMVMMVFCFAEFVFNIWALNDFEDDSQGFEQVEGTIDGGEANPSSLLQKRPVKLLGVQRFTCAQELFMDQKSGMAQSKPFLSDEVFQNPCVHHSLKVE